MAKLTDGVYARTVRGKTRMWVVRGQVGTHLYSGASFKLSHLAAADWQWVRGIDERHGEQPQAL